MNNTEQGKRRKGFAEVLHELKKVRVQAMEEGNTEVVQNITDVLARLWDERGMSFGVVDGSKTNKWFFGCGNSAQRRQGINTERGSCGCVTCQVYGGDCSRQIWREEHDQWHRKQRGIKTKLSRRIIFTSFGGNTWTIQRRGEQ